jgi:hypothetical protein
VVLVGFYLLLWAVPQRRLFRRPAAILYGKFWCLFRLLSLSASAISFSASTAAPSRSPAPANATAAAANCVYVLGTLYPFAVLQPLVMYYTLLQDSRWWQGRDIRQGRRVEAAEEIRGPLHGVDFTLATALSLAASMDHLGKATAEKGSSRLSQARKVKLLNFGDYFLSFIHFYFLLNDQFFKAYITLDNSRMVGSGSFSKVFLGSYRKQKCAIKLIFTPDLTEDVIDRISAEVQILSFIKVLF